LDDDDSPRAHVGGDSVGDALADGELRRKVRNSVSGRCSVSRNSVFKALDLSIARPSPQVRTPIPILSLIANQAHRGGRQ
jgi:hypothetical protein